MHAFKSHLHTEKMKCRKGHDLSEVTRLLNLNPLLTPKQLFILSATEKTQGRHYSRKAKKNRECKAAHGAKSQITTKLSFIGIITTSCFHGALNVRHGSKSLITQHPLGHELITPFHRVGNWAQRGERIHPRLQ